jgi:CheY-like chemotaxis protein
MGLGHAEALHSSTANVLVAETCLGPYEVRSISAELVCLVGGPALPVGARVKLVVRAAGRVSFEVRAEVLEPRTDDDGTPCVELRLRGLHPSLARALPTLSEVIERLLSPRLGPVLVVDDCPRASRALSRDLRRMGLTVLTASTPLAAVEQILSAEPPIQAAIVDFHLGHSVGTELLDFLRTEHPEVRRIFFSADDQACEVERSDHRDRSHDVLDKPWDQNALARALERGPSARRA